MPDLDLIKQGKQERCAAAAGAFVEAQAPRRDVSIPRVAGRSREGDRVTHVGEARDVGEGALEAEAEAGVRHRAVAAQIAVPGVVLAVDAALGDTAVQYVEPLLALAAADDLADPWRQYVHCRDRAPITDVRCADRHSRPRLACSSSKASMICGR